MVTGTKTRVSFLAALITSFLVAFAAQAAPSQKFTFRLIAEPETLDWNRAHTPIENYLLINLMEGLVGLDSALKPAPALAESWKVSHDGKTYTFHLRPGVLWSDGVPLRAADFVYSWRRLLDRRTAAPYAYLLFDIQGAQAYSLGKLTDFSKVGIHALDDHTLEVRLSHPVAYWIFIPSFWVTYPLREDVVAKYPTDWDQPGKMITLGAYTLASHELESRIVLKANPRYYGTRGNLDEAVGLIVKDDSTAVTLFESGRIDFMTDVPSLDQERLQSDSRLKRFPYLKTAYLGFDVQSPLLKSVRLRQAIAQAIDRSKWSELLHGGQTPAHSWIAPPLLGSNQTEEWAYDPAAAKKALAEAGLTSPIHLDVLLLNAEKPLVVGQYLQGELQKNLGVEIRLQPFDNKTFRAHLRTHTYPVFISSWSADYPDPDTFAGVFLSDSGNNWMRWKNPAFDRAVITARESQNLENREKNYSEAQRILLKEETAIVPLYFEPNSVLLQDRVQGLELDPLNNFYLKKVHLAN